jgi:hypothetical protein
MCANLMPGKKETTEVGCERYITGASTPCVVLYNPSGRLDVAREFVSFLAGLS